MQSSAQLVLPLYTDLSELRIAQQKMLRLLKLHLAVHSTAQLRQRNTWIDSAGAVLCTASEGKAGPKHRAAKTSTASDAEHKKNGSAVPGCADQYPWLDEKDPRRNMLDKEILDKCINLKESTLTEKEKKSFMKMLLKHREAFSLRDEIGHCPNITVDIDVIDDSPFFVRPFPISETDKPIMDKQMKRLVSLGILSRNTTSHTSPVMLITRKITQDKRPVVDFRLLNTRIRRQNTATPLLRDNHQMLGKSFSDTLSCVNIRDAFHSLKFHPKRLKIFVELCLILVVLIIGMKLCLWV